MHLLPIGAVICGLMVAQAEPAGAIAGSVVDANSNKPIRRANVVLSTVEARPQDALAWTDGDGRFSFGYLPAGSYQLRASKDGYQMAAYGTQTPQRPPATIRLADGEVRNDFIFRLKPPMSISGVVLDEDGDPLAGVEVTLMTPGFERRQRKLLPGNRAATDTDGRYRLTASLPGRYAVHAAPRRRALIVHPEPIPGEVQKQYSYGTQYYPGVDVAESAALIAVQPGREILRIDFRLTPRPTVSLQAKIVMPFEVADIRERSITAIGDQLADGMNMWTGPSPPGASVQISQIPPGTYLLVAQATVDGKPYRGVQTAYIGPEGPSEIAIPVEPGIDLAGSVSVEGPGAEKYYTGSVSLVPGDNLPLNGPPLRASVNKDGSFKIAGVPPGVWDINAGPLPSGGYVKSMRLGDQDVLTEEMAIHSTTTAALKIVLSTQGAILEGTVMQQDQSARSFVLLAPEAKLRDVIGFYRFAVSDDKGHFEIKGVRPGRYELYAFEELNQRSVQDADFLKPFESAGVAVTLHEGQNEPRKISVIPARSPAGAHE
jgi:protocatechuate 3,4-dioxygenase beta subunit